jgi:predicted DCC family thiol-disulfide oxidoreductase YuxK
MNNNKFIIIFDGDCGICNRTQMWIKKNDKSGKFDIHPYQFFDYKSFDLNESDVSSSVYLFKNEKKYCRSAAVFQILKELSFPWNIIGSVLSNSVFVFLLNPVYDIISRNRSRISGVLGLNSCKL